MNDLTRTEAPPVPAAQSSAEAAGPAKGTVPSVQVDRKTPPTRDDVRRQIESTRASISLRLDAIQHEITSAGDDAKRYVQERPLVGIGIALGLGLATGWVAGGRLDRQKRDDEHLVSLIREELMAGRSVAEAAREAAERVRDVVTPDPPERKQKSSFMRPLLTSLATVALREVVRRMLSDDTPQSDEPAGDADPA